MNYMHSQFYILFAIAFLIDSIYSGSRAYTSGTKYDNSYYIDLFRVQNYFISSLFSPGCTKASLNNIIDNNYNTLWVSQTEGSKVKDPTTGQTYNPLKVNLTFTFTRDVLIGKMIYQANSIGSSNPVGYPEELNIYYATSNNDHFVLLDQIKSVATDKKVVFIFSKSVKCRKINLEWKKISISTNSNYKNKGTAKEIIFLYPEIKNINSTLLNAFDKSDYKELTLSKEWKNLSNIENLYTEAQNNYFNVGGFNIINNVSRILNIYKKNLKYDSKREFSTVVYKMSPINHLKQFGDIEGYARNTLKMSRGGTNRQSTGIFAKPRENIYVYVKTQKNTNLLPSIQFSQFIGNRSNWLGSPKKLKLGKNLLIADDFQVTNDYEIPTYPGGIYISNPFNTSQQGEISVYIEGGTVFPTYRINTNETAYRENLEKWVNLVKKMIKFILILLNSLVID